MGTPTVCVVMSTYNGEKYLREQIDSLINQKDVSVKIYVRDDGSTDSTIQILKAYNPEILQYVVGENCGAKVSFLKALSMAPECEYYAFSDQDDVWDEDKLISAIRIIQKQEILHPDKYILYKGKTRLVDNHLRPLSSNRKLASDIIFEKPFLRGQSRNSAGCTMVFNSKLRTLVSTYTPTIFPMHDAWINYVCLAVDGIVICDTNPHISYRQHAGNVVGGKKNIFKSIRRRFLFYKKMGRSYQSKMYKEIVDNFGDRMTVENIDRCKTVISYKKSLKNKILLLFDKEFMNGEMKYKIEQIALILFNAY